MRKNRKNVGDGMDLLRSLRSGSVPLVLFDPQYRAVLDRMSYGNTLRMRGRWALPQMGWTVIEGFISEIHRVLRPSGHLMMWVDKFTLCEGKTRFSWFPTVDLITWQKRRMGMGYRTRRKCEYLVIYQKTPLRAKGRWRDRGISDVWTHDMETYAVENYGLIEEEVASRHTHAKPLGLQRRLIECVTRRGDIVVDPCAGGYSVMAAARSCGREYLGCDLI